LAINDEKSDSKKQSTHEINQTPKEIKAANEIEKPQKPD